MKLPSGGLVVVPIPKKHPNDAKSFGDGRGEILAVNTPVIPIAAPPAIPTQIAASSPIKITTQPPTKKAKTPKLAISPPTPKLAMPPKKKKKKKKAAQPTKKAAQSPIPLLTVPAAIPPQVAAPAATATAVPKAGPVAVCPKQKQLRLAVLQEAAKRLCTVTDSMKDLQRMRRLITELEAAAKQGDINPDTTWRNRLVGATQGQRKDRVAQKTLDTVIADVERTTARPTEGGPLAAPQSVRQSTVEPTSGHWRNHSAAAPFDKKYDLEFLENSGCFDHRLLKDPYGILNENDTTSGYSESLSGYQWSEESSDWNNNDWISEFQREVTAVAKNWVPPKEWISATEIDASGAKPAQPVHHSEQETQMADFQLAQQYGVGFKLMAKWGYSGGGLGRGDTAGALVAPLKVVIRQRNRGLSERDIPRSRNGSAPPPAANSRPPAL